ncbi:MAG: amidohydrolase family protein [Acidimicrobiales bacterium]|nr:amidohydrolase family protein [Acidimicrobiales bacterium]
MTAVVVVDAEIGGRPGRAVRLDGGCVVDVDDNALVDRTDADVIDARGGALLPGLHDHHLHLLAWAARLGSVDLGPLVGPAAVDRHLTAAVAAPRTGRWLRVAGYDEHDHGPMDRDRLDATCGAVPVRVQHRSGLSWVVSTAGLVALGLDPAPGPGAAAGDPPAGVERADDGSATGWLHRLDGWLRGRVGAAPPDLAEVARRLAAHGITGVTDTTPSLDDGALDLLVGARADGTLRARLTVLGRPDDDRLGPWADLGPRKLVVDEHRGLDVDELARRMARVHDSGRAVAVHCVTRAECVAAVAALRQAGARRGDRLEHASLLPPALDGYLATVPVTVVTQPSFVAERGDHYLAAVDPVDLPDLYRLASLRRAGVPVALSSDAPVASADPWAAVAASVERRTAAGVVLGPDEALTAGEALAGYLTPALDPGGPVRTVEVGRPADLCLLHQPLAAALRAPSSDHVRFTFFGGEAVHG